MAVYQGNPAYIGLGKSTGGFDFYQRPVDTVPADDSREARDFRNNITFKPVAGPDGKQVPNVVEALISVYDLAYGLNRYWGTTRPPSVYWPYSDLGRMQSSVGMLTHDHGVASLAPALGSSSVGATFTYPTSSANIFGKHVIGMGSAANNSLFVETSSTNPTLVARTFSPGSVITHLDTGVIGGYSAATSLFVSLANGAPKVLSDLGSTPTVTGSMHSQTSPSFGVVATPLNASSPGTNGLLIYGNHAFQFLDGTSAYNAQPTVTIGNITNGGHPVGIVNLPGAPIRIYWYLPRQDQGQAHIYDSGSGATPLSGGYLVSTNLEGTDLQTIALPIKVLFACQIDEQTIWVSDGLQLFEISDKVRNLYWNSQRLRTALAQPQIHGLGSFEGQGYVVSVYDAFYNPGAAYQWQVERYNRATNSFSPITDQLGQNVVGDIAAWPSNSDFNLKYQYASYPTGSLPFSPYTRNLHVGINNSSTLEFMHSWIPLDGAPAFFNNNDVDAANTSIAQTWTSTGGQIYSPVMTIEGYEGAPFVVEEVIMLGDVQAGGDDSYVELRIANETQLGGTATNPGWDATGGLAFHFSGKDRYSTQRARQQDNTAWATRLQWLLVMARSSVNTKRTANALPFQIRLLIFTDGKVRSPLEVRGY